MSEENQADVYSDADAGGRSEAAAICFRRERGSISCFVVNMHITTLKRMLHAGIVQKYSTTAKVISGRVLRKSILKSCDCVANTQEFLTKLMVPQLQNSILYALNSYDCEESAVLIQ